MTSNITDDLFSHVGPESQSWSDSVENTVSWDIDAQTVISATPTVATVDSRQKVVDTCAQGIER